LFKLGRGPAVFRGTRWNDDIRGFSGPDRILSGRGDDDVRGGRGRDLIVGGPGSDSLWGGKDGDVIRSQSGDDWINVRDSTRDRVYCGKGHDTVMADRKDWAAKTCETVERKR
jgi:Ca2+-binding RTX toxin-like protein